MALTQFQISILFVVVLIALGLMLLIAFFISRKYPSNKKRTDSIIKWLIILMIIFMLHVSLVVFGVIDQEQLKSSIKYYVIALISIIAFYIIKKLFLDKAIPTEKLLKQYVLPSARELYGALKYKGYASVPHFLFSTVVPSGYNLTSRAFEEEGVDLMEVFLLRLSYGGKGVIMDVMDIRNKFTGEGLQHIRNPDLATVQQWMGREVMKSYQEKQETEGNKESNETRTTQN